MKKAIFLRSAVLFLASLILIGCATAPTAPPPGATKADFGFPATGAKLVFRTLDHEGKTSTETWTILAEGTYEGKPVLKISDGVNIRIFSEKGNWIATTLRGKERYSAYPDEGTFSWPLFVGKSYVARYHYYDRDRGRSFDVEYWWEVKSYEDVKVPAGSFKAFVLEGSNPYATTKLWYAPDLKFFVKRIFERSAASYRGYGKFDSELIEYVAK